MRRSEAITSLAKALAQAQAEITPPKKNKTAKVETQKGAYSYKYANLADMKEGYRGPLHKHGLSITHAIEPENGHLILSSTLLHESGEWIASDYPVASYPRPQELGSAITYGKKYNVGCLLDISSEEDDDDGQAAQNAEPVKAKPKPAPEPDDDPRISPEEAEEVRAAAKKAGFTTARGFSPFLESNAGVSSVQDIRKSRLSGVLAELKALEDAPA